MCTFANKTYQIDNSVVHKIVSHINLLQLFETTDFICQASSLSTTLNMVWVVRDILGYQMIQVSNWK